MPKYYAVRVGRQPGIYTTWAQAEAQVKGFSNAEYRSFTTRKAAQEYLDNNVKPLITNMNGVDVANTDGSCVSGRAGYGFLLQGKEYCGPLMQLDGTRDGFTNNQAELSAIYMCIIKAMESKIAKLIIRTDSGYAIGCLTNWKDKWDSSGWQNSRGDDVKNANIIQAIIALLTQIDVTFMWVKGHNGDPGNEAADILANHGRMA